MEADTHKRFDRLVAILTQLQSKKIIKSQELADRFGVSLRTIYRDLQTLEKVGVPLFGEAGVGYSLVDGYRLPPVMFTREEASSFLAAEKLMQQFTDSGFGKNFASAMFKIKSVLRGVDKEWLTALDAQVTVHSSRTVFNQSVPNALEILFESLAEKKQVLLEYQKYNSEHPESRNIEPVGLFHENQFWYVMGYCHLRKDYRQFRLDRIQKISMNDKPFTRQHRSVEEYRKLQSDKKQFMEVKLKIDKSVSRYIASGFQNYKLVSKKETKNHLLLVLQIPDLDPGFVRWILMFADYLHVIEPTSLRMQLKEALVKALKKIDK